MNGWFILPYWVFFFSRHMSLQELGLADGIAIILGMVMEIPSGALSDLLGKRYTLIFGNILVLISALTMAHATTFSAFLITNIICLVGIAFTSGSLEAFAYDTLVEHGKADKFRIIMSRYTTIFLSVMIFSTFMGGYFYSIDGKLGFYAWAIFLFIALVLLALTKEPTVDTYHFNLRNYFLQLKEGTLSLFSEKLKRYIFPILFLTLFIKTYAGMIRQSIAIYFGFQGDTFGYTFSFIMIPALLVGMFFDRLRQRLSEKKLLIMVLFYYFLAFSIALVFNNITAGIATFFVIILAEKLAQPLISVIVNERIDSKHRTTVLSTLAFFSRIPYIILVTFFAFMAAPEHIYQLYILFLLALSVALCYVMVYIKEHTGTN